MIATRSTYQTYKNREWRFCVHSGLWNQGLWEEVLYYLKSSPMSNHPQTIQLHHPRDDNGEKYYLKIYYRSDILESIKDLFRISKSFRALRQSQALLQEGFHTPITVGAGEQRSIRFIKKSFLLTLSVDGILLPYFLRKEYMLSIDRSTFVGKRQLLKSLAKEIRRLHQLGFIHGDLVPYNILVHSKYNKIRFYFIDNDRTRRYPPWLAHEFCKRNLVQLNRFSLPGITKSDRFRFFLSYLGKSRLGQNERRIAQLVDVATQKRIQRIVSK